MKKKFVILIALLAMTAFAGSAFAGAIEIDTTGSEIGDATFVPSTGVTVGLFSTATEYSANSKHLSGSKCYATLSTGSDIQDGPCDVGDVITAPTTSNTIALTSAP